jgi:hypothetical protein
MNSELRLSRLLGLWLASFGGLLVFLYALFIGSEVGGRSMFQSLFR